MIKNFIRIITPSCAMLTYKIYFRYKLSHFFYRKGWIHIANFISYRIYKKYKCWISYESCIGRNIKFPHPIGIVIGAGVQIEDNVTIYQNVTLGRKNKDIAEYPKIGNNVTIYSNSVVVGDISIGDNTIIGCNSTILKSVEPNSKCVGVVK